MYSRGQLRCQRRLTSGTGGSVRVREEALQQGAHLVAVPLPRAECHADGVAAGAYEERGRKSGHAPRLRGFEVGDGEEFEANPAFTALKLRIWRSVKEEVEAARA